MRRLLLLSLAVLVAGCATRGVRDTAGAPLITNDPIGVQMANRIDNTETALVFFGNLALSKRHLVADEDWDRFADKFAIATKYVESAASALTEYRANRNDQTESRLNDAVVFLESLANSALTYGKSVVPGAEDVDTDIPLILGGLEPVTADLNGVRLAVTEAR